MVQSIKCGGGRCLLQENSSHHPCRSRFLLLLSFPLSLGFNGVPVILWLSCFPRVSAVLGVCLSFFAWIGQLHPRIGLFGPRLPHKCICRDREMDNTIKNSSIFLEKKLSSKNYTLYHITKKLCIPMHRVGLRLVIIIIHTYDTAFLSFKLYHAIKLRFHFSLIRTNAKSIWTNAQSCKGSTIKLLFHWFGQMLNPAKGSTIKLLFHWFGQMLNPAKGSTT